MIVVTDEEINEVLNQCSDSADTGESVFPGESYESGVKCAIEWLTGESDVSPFED